MGITERVRRVAPPALFARGEAYAHEGGVVRLAEDRYAVRVAGRTDGVEVWCDGGSRRPRPAGCASATAFVGTPRAS